MSLCVEGEERAASPMRGCSSPDDSTSTPPDIHDEPTVSQKNKRSRAPTNKPAKSEEEEKPFQIVATQVNGCLKMTFQCVLESCDEAGMLPQPRHNKVYTELSILKGEGEEVQHQAPPVVKTKPLNDDREPLTRHDIFRPSNNTKLKTVMTTGIAGAGKSFLVRKFILDWSEGNKNQDVDLVFLTMFQDLNLVKDEQFSLMGLLRHLNPPLDVPIDYVSCCKVLFIFDGLDESVIPLDFQHNAIMSNITEQTSIGTLLTNLILGNMLPNALIWVTSRPVAANQIPPGLIDRMTEIHGFTEAQREDYFRKRFNKKLANKIISHIKSSRTLHNMCHVPMFCWICATVLEHHILNKPKKVPMPNTLKEMYTSIMLLKTERKLETLT